ncbi:MAG: hypothetical protein IT372_40740 [Polyangiaceae bacterium]|nr:hypothetical protein [Polyangiaceae bacterium]
MRVWTRGAEHVALTDKGTFIFRQGAPPRWLEAPRAARDEGAGDVLAVAPSGAFAWVERLARVSLADGAVERPPRAAPVDDVVALDDERVAAVLGGATKKAPPTLVVGDPRAAAWEVRVELRAEAAKRVEAFSKVIWAEGAAPPWYRATAFGPGTVEGARQTRVTSNEHGVAVAGSRSGLVGVLRPGADKLTSVFRVPSQDEAVVDAVATERGVLVTLAIEGRHAAVAHFDEGGRCLGATGMLHGATGALVVGDRVLVFDDRDGEGLVRVLRLPALEEASSVEPCAIGGMPIDAHASRDGRAAVFGVGGEVVVVAVTPDGLEVTGRCAGAAPARSKPAAERAAEVRPPPPRWKPCEGAPALGFAVSKATPAPWSGAAGAPMEIAMGVRSTGGPGAGVRVELSGPALVEGLVVPDRVVIGPHSARFEADARIGGFAALLPAVPLPRGMIYPFDPKPTSPEAAAEAHALLAATHLDVRLELRAARPGSAFLSVAMRAGAGAAAPMKWTRPVTVEG